MDVLEKVKEGLSGINRTLVFDRVNGSEVGTTRLQKIKNVNIKYSEAGMVANMPVFTKNDMIELSNTDLFQFICRGYFESKIESTTRFKYFETNGERTIRLKRLLKKKLLEYKNIIVEFEEIFARKEANQQSDKFSFVKFFQGEQICEDLTPEETSTNAEPIQKYTNSFGIRIIAADKAVVILNPTNAGSSMDVDPEIPVTSSNEVDLQSSDSEFYQNSELFGKLFRLAWERLYAIQEVLDGNRRSRVYICTDLLILLQGLLGICVNIEHTNAAILRRDLKNFTHCASIDSVVTRKEYETEKRKDTYVLEVLIAIPFIPVDDLCNDRISFMYNCILKMIYMKENLDDALGVIMERYEQNQLLLTNFVQSLLLCRSFSENKKKLTNTNEPYRVVELIDYFFAKLRHILLSDVYDYYISQFDSIEQHSFNSHRLQGSGTPMEIDS